MSQKRLKNYILSPIGAIIIVSGIILGLYQVIGVSGIHPTMAGCCGIAVFFTLTSATFATWIAYDKEKTGK